MSTSIEWTDATWNPIRARRRADGKVGWHCVKVNDACRNCYAEHQNVVAGTNPGRHGNGVPYAADKLPLVEYFLDQKTLEQPLHWKAPRKIFPCSMTDLYGDFVPALWLDQIYRVMALTPQHLYIVLTKRSARRRAFLTRTALTDCRALPNVIEMASFGRQKDADVELPLLLATPAAMRGASVEPMLEAIDLVRYISMLFYSPQTGLPLHPALNWVICGGESGSQARPFNLAWAEFLRQQCKAAGVPFFMKQVGSFALSNNYSLRAGTRCEMGKLRIVTKDRKGGDPSEWPESLRVRQWPSTEERQGLAKKI